MNKFLQKCVNLLLVFSMLLTLVPGLGITVHADGTSVEIVSFVRGSVDDLRSSELLEARVSGYEGNLSDLTFTWSNQLGTYLYVYNSSNMYNIKDTAGEVELDGTSWKVIWEDILPEIVKVDGDTASLKGYAWAAVYGANLTSDKLEGYISVTVTDKEGNVIGEATYDNKFLSPSLSQDLLATSYGVFEGETINIKDMLGRSSIVHIDCKECKVSAASVTSGGEYITLVNSDGNYKVTGNSAGHATVSITLKKDNCKFHQNSQQRTVTHNVYVFKKPATSTTTTTLTLTNLDSACEYFIGAKEGTKSADGKSIVFTDLEPDTSYEVMVRGKYTAEDGVKYVYAYVTDVTKPVFKATVNCYTDDKLADFLEYFGAGQNLYIKESSDNKYIQLTREAAAVYSAGVENGIYYVYYKNGDEYTRIGDYQITIDNANNTLNIYTYSLRYDLAGGTMVGGGSVNYEGTAVYATSEIPAKEGSIFTGWTYDNKSYKSGQLVTEKISKPVVLTANWEESTDVKVNITINHVPATGGYDVAASRADVEFRLVDTASNAPVSNKVTLKADSHDGYAFTTGENTTTYTADTAAFAGKKGVNYTLSFLKSGYEVISVEQTEAADGTIVLNAELEYDPKNFDMNFKVVMDDAVPQAFYPAGVDVKITYLKDSDWIYISQHDKGSAVHVEIGENGEGYGVYPVWKTVAGTDEVYYYGIDVVSYVLEDGTVVTNAANAYISNEYVEGTDAVGAYYESEAQHGVPVAEITISSYDITLHANGGKINGSAAQTLEKQVVIPDMVAYVPERDGGYTFTGWYTDSACTTKAQSGARIYEATTLYAGWEAPLTVSGSISVEGFYYQDGKKVDVLDVDRAKNIVTTLQVVNGDKFNDVASVKGLLEYGNDGIAKVNYQFTEVPNALASGAEYRIRTALINYETLYDNNNDKNFASAEYTANFNSDKEAVVDALLKFKADEYVQNYEIDATLIGEGFRPANGVTQVLFRTDGNGAPDTVISQHTVSPYGEAFTFGNDGIANGSLSLWKGISSGAMSSYQLNVTNIDGKEYNSESTYSVRYGAVANFSAVEGSAETLKATLVPNEYVVNFDLNADGDAVGGMDIYKSADGESYFATHKWSYNTPIAAVPTREGYVFAGWEAADGVLVDGKYISAEVAETVTVTATWAKFEWVTDTDSGYVEAENGKESVLRFLFDVATTDSLKGGITQTGIKFIKSNDISGKVEDSNVAGKALTGSSTTFYGDVTNIPESKAALKYYAIGFVVCNGEIYWSLPVEGGPNFDELISYE